MVNYRGYPRNYYGATPVKANNRIVCTNGSGVIDSSLIPIDLGANKYTRSVSPPGNPVIGDLWDELGNDWLSWRYSGTHWMSLQIFQQSTGARSAVTTFDTRLNTDYLSIRYDIYVLFFVGVTTVATTNNSTNYWSATFRRTTSAAVDTIISTINTIDGSPDTYLKSKNQLNLLIDTATVASFAIRNQRTGTPGLFVGSYAVVFRWVRI